MQMSQGKFIVLYGINNLGKTTQAKMLTDQLNFYGLKAEYLKYPVYDLIPSGVILNSYLRQGNPHNLTPKEAQIIYAFNRTQYEKTLLNKLAGGINIVAEDYSGSGIAWGMGAGVDEQFLKYINSHLLKEDLAFLLDGERFRQAAENNHRHETDDELIEKVRLAHLKLGWENNWIKINANLKIEQIHQYIWNHLLKLLIRSFPKKNLTFNFKEGGKKSTAATEWPGGLKLKVEKISPWAKLPTRAYADDAGLDLYSADYYSLIPGDCTTIKTGLKIALPQGYAGLIWDKGGIAKSGVHSLAGVIDSGYKGELTVQLVNLSQNIYHIAPGQKIAQLLIQKMEFPEITEDKIIDTTDRNNNRFGSSGLF
ncbi:hypothetical protein CO116_02890 [Candidatus Falkowbacteria bacterium CG_4_9_14_3_um_filter_38_19]|uniref:dUTP diphosphatase n=1 Tax=Candidatus Falkowbacteria bacterium CG_4_9_14_3_um_filter_38_19 TaxID=1974559 RepID=A0A2M8AEI4_9BACT|nr:MAG: hypothetical protein CO116_02890 [Candidatus Falkowbacteria bacterium CG_4_9_14_3_um_filter_38_19]